MTGQTEEGVMSDGDKNRKWGQSTQLRFSHVSAVSEMLDMRCGMNTAEGKRGWLISLWIERGRK